MSGGAFDAVVIGGGPAGSAVSILLAAGGWSVAVVEKSAFPRRKVCGEFVSATSVTLLDRLGIGADFVALAGPEVTCVGLFAADTKLAAPMPRVAGGVEWGRALGRETLDALLVDRAVSAGASVWQPYRAVSVERTGEGWRVEIASESAVRILRAPIVVAAHGSWERGPLPTQAARTHRASDLLAFKAHFLGAALLPDLMPLLAFPGGYGGMVHSDRGRVSLSLCIRRDMLAACRAQRPGERAGAAVLAHIFEHCEGVREVISGARLDGDWLSAGPIAPGIRLGRGDGIFRVGNAAGEAHPIVAEGISMALQGAEILARHVLAEADPLTETRRAEILRDYARDWRRNFAPRIRAAALFAALAMRPASATLLLPALRRFPAALSLGARLSGKVRGAETGAHAAG